MPARFDNRTLDCLPLRLHYQAGASSGLTKREHQLKGGVFDRSRNNAFRLRNATGWSRAPFVKASRCVRCRRLRKEIIGRDELIGLVNHFEPIVRDRSEVHKSTSMYEQRFFPIPLCAAAFSFSPPLTLPDQVCFRPHNVSSLSLSALVFHKHFFQTHHMAVQLPLQLPKISWTINSSRADSSRTITIIITIINYVKCWRVTSANRHRRSKASSTYRT